MNRLTAGLLLGLVAGVPAGAAIHALYARLDASLAQVTTSAEAPNGPSTYLIYVNSRLPEPELTPVRAFVEAGNTVIEFEAPIPKDYAPVLFVGEGPNTSRYTVNGNRYTVDGIISQNSYLVGPSKRPTMSSQVLIEPQFEPWRK